MAMGDVQTAPAPVKDVSDRAANTQSGDQGWNGNAARDIWGKPPVPAAQPNDAGGKDTQSKTAGSDAATSSANDQASDQSVKSTAPKEATTNANDQSRNNNAKDQMRRKQEATKAGREFDPKTYPAFDVKNPIQSRDEVFVDLYAPEVQPAQAG